MWSLMALFTVVTYAGVCRRDAMLVDKMQHVCGQDACRQDVSRWDACIRKVVVPLNVKIWIKM